VGGGQEALDGGEEVPVVCGLCRREGDKIRGGDLVAGGEEAGGAAAGVAG